MDIHAIGIIANRRRQCELRSEQNGNAIGEMEDIDPLIETAFDKNQSNKGYSDFSGNFSGDRALSNIVLAFSSCNACKSKVSTWLDTAVLLRKMKSIRRLDDGAQLP